MNLIEKITKFIDNSTKNELIYIDNFGETKNDIIVFSKRSFEKLIIKTNKTILVFNIDSVETKILNFNEILNSNRIDIEKPKKPKIEKQKTKEEEKIKEDYKTLYKNNPFNPYGIIYHDNVILKSGDIGIIITEPIRHYGTVKILYPKKFKKDSIQKIRLTQLRKYNIEN